MSRPAALLLTGLLLAGCASPSQPTSESAPTVIHLEQIASAVAGDYVSVRQSGDLAEPIRLRIDPQQRAAAITLIMTQHRAGIERVFELQFAPSADANRFDAHFIPLQTHRADAAPACHMRFRLAAGVLVGETDPNECRFRSGENFIGLLKEIVFERDRIRMADQLVLEDGSLFGDADRLTLTRVTHFTGMLARNEEGAWRIARNLRLSSGGNLVEPLDAAGMSLGLLLNLELVESPERQVPALRLQVIEEATGRITTEVWHTIDASLIGLGLDTLRIELHRET